MRKVSSDDTLIVKLARTVGNAAGRMAAATHDLAENAAAAVRSSGSSSNQREHSVSPARNKRARIAQRTPKKVSRSSARARSCEAITGGCGARPLGTSAGGSSYAVAANGDGQ